VTPTTTTESRHEAAIAARVAAGGLALYTVTRILGVAFASASMASSVSQAIAAEWGAGRLGVTWSDPAEPLPSTGAMAKRAAIGAACGAAAAGVLVGLALATRAAILDPPQGPPSWSLFLLGLLGAGLTAMRDELILHGITLRALGSLASPVGRALACGVTSAAAAAGDPSVTPRLVAAHFLLGSALGALWVRDRGAWLAWGAHTSFLFVLGTVFGGGAGQLRIAQGSFGGGDAGILGGTAALVALAPVFLVALGAVRRKVRHDGHT